jgi:radical SAM protein with 4Fe4S-binding SPASM domain
MRIIAQHQKELAQPHGKQHGGRGCMAGNGFCFISHVGDVFGCGFLPVPAGNIRTQNFKEIYQKSQLFLQLRNHELLKGKCGSCEYKLLCGGCRARALSVNRNYLQEEPYCLFQPKK